VSRAKGRKPAKGPAAKHRVDRLAEAANRGWVVWLGIVVAVAGFAYVVADHWPRSTPNPDIAVCKAIDLDQAEQDSLDTTGRPYLMEIRRRLVNRFAEAQQGGTLATAIGINIEWVDFAVALTSNPKAGASEVQSAMEGFSASAVAVSEACDEIGYRIKGYRANETADGSISDVDARLYCESALEFLTTAAESKPGDQHFRDVWQVLTTRSLKGLPPEVYVATIELNMMVLEAYAGKPYPPAEKAAHVIAGYCVGRGMTGWPWPK